MSWVIVRLETQRSDRETYLFLDISGKAFVMWLSKVQYYLGRESGSLDSHGLDFGCLVTQNAITKGGGESG